VMCTVCGDLTRRSHVSLGAGVNLRVVCNRWGTVYRKDALLSEENKFLLKKEVSNLGLIDARK